MTTHTHMDIRSGRLPYAATHAFTPLVQDYVQADPFFEDYISHWPNWQGIEAAIAARQSFATDRKLLVEVLQQQYAQYPMHARQKANLNALLQENTYTVVTAHQPNIFTGPLYFIYKILHAIRLAEAIAERHPNLQVVPVYYMGSEDADLDELGHFFVEGEKLTWHTPQQGAVGRMHTKGLESLIDRLQGQFGQLPHGNAMIDMLRKAYTQHGNIQQATHYLVNALFDRFGLLVLVPDDARLKRAFNWVVRRELLEGFAQPLVEATTHGLGQRYKVQAGGRPINLFYLNQEGRRERIVQVGNTWQVEALGLSFSESAILDELETHPERFSANVVLRPLFQEMLLPNLAFVGGGGELAYWLELRRIFEACAVPYPVLVLRNSFLLLTPKAAAYRQKLNLSYEQLFLPEHEAMDVLVNQRQHQAISTAQAAEVSQALFAQLQHDAAAIDGTLQPHVAAVQTRLLQYLKGIEQKMKRAARRKLQDEQGQWQKMHEAIFPGGSLQERKENFMPLFAAYGPPLLDALYQHSQALEANFCVLEWPAASGS